MADLDPELLKILVCPETHETVAPAGTEELQRLQARRQAGQLRTQSGEPAGPFEGLLVRADGKVAYPVVEGIPVMLIDERIVLDDE